MKSKLSCLILFIIGFFNIPSIAQKIYPVIYWSGCSQCWHDIDETLTQTVSTTDASVPYVNYNICRRQYMLGVPLAIKLGS